MKVRELIAELQKLDPELEVFKQKDDEGNGYSPVHGADDDAYSTDTSERDLEIVTKNDIEWYVKEYEYDESDFVQVVVIY